jgi:hypothetical protein
MSRCILFLTALLALPAFAQSSDPTPPPVSDVAPEAAPPAEAQAAPEAAPAPAPASAPAPAAAPVTPEMTPEQKLTQLRHDQINLLALRGDAGSLVAAVLMAGADADDKRRPPALKSPALLKRAQTVGADNVLVWWVTASLDCRSATKTCPHPETLQKLETLDAGNAAVWALSLWRAQQGNDAPAARAALASAAQATKYNDYFGTVIDDLYEAQGILPMSNDLLNATGQNVSVSGYRLIFAAGIAAAMVQTEGAAIRNACKSADPSDTALIADCVAVAQKMELSGSINSQNSGLSLKMALLPSGPERDAARARQRALAWQTLRISDLGDRLATNPTVSRVYTQALNESGNESSAVLAVLRSQGVALEPPADWQPPQAETVLTP